jgi:hypothetical protein
VTRLPYADVSIATILVVVGVALAAYPWLEGDSVSLLVGAVLVIAGALGVLGLRRPRGVVSGEILVQRLGGREPIAR